jgi:uncharacterized Zn finger protein
MTQIQPEYASCPNCGSVDVHKVKYTWWGGLVGPALFKHVKCNQCGTTYNGKTGQSNTTNIIIYSVVGFVVACGLCGVLAMLLYVVNTYQG